MYKVFIDGSAGTTGLKIFERFRGRSELELLTLPESQRKDLHARMDRICSADVSFLCLPDAASREICSQLPEDVRLLDTSTAHRTAAGWVYGFPELSGAQRSAVASAKRVAVPGCHATGFVALAAPLVALGIASPDYPFDEDFETAVLRHTNNRKWFAIVMKVSRRKFGFDNDDVIDVVNLKIS